MDPKFGKPYVCMTCHGTEHKLYGKKSVRRVCTPCHKAASRKSNKVRNKVNQYKLVAFKEFCKIVAQYANATVYDEVAKKNMMRLAAKYDLIEDQKMLASWKKDLDYE